MRHPVQVPKFMSDFKNLDKMHDNLDTQKSKRKKKVPASLRDTYDVDCLEEVVAFVCVSGALVVEVQAQHYDCRCRIQLRCRSKSRSL